MSKPSAKTVAAKKPAAKKTAAKPVTARASAPAKPKAAAPAKKPSAKTSVKPAIKPAAPNPNDPDDPTKWRCSFKVMRWVHPEDDDKAPSRRSGPSSKPAQRPRFLSYEDIVAFTPRPQTPERDIRAGAVIARRIEALSRILEKPARAIRRIARFFAGMPREALEPPNDIWVSTLSWHHGRLEYLAAQDIAERAFMMFARLRLRDFDGPQPEPG